MRRSVSRLWTPKYFRHSRVKHSAAADANNSVHHPDKRPQVLGASINEQRFPSHRGEAPQRASNNNRRREAFTPEALRRAELAKETRCVAVTAKKYYVHSNTSRCSSVAHQSAIKMVRSSLAVLAAAKEQNRTMPFAEWIREKNALRQQLESTIFEAKTKVLPSVALLLPEAIQREERIDVAFRSPEIAGDGTAAPARFVVVPTDRIPALANASDAAVSSFLRQTTQAVSCSDGQDIEETSSYEQRAKFSVNELSDILRLVAEVGYHNAEFIVRVTSELERFLKRRVLVPAPRAADDKHPEQAVSGDQEVLDGGGAKGSWHVSTEYLLAPVTVSKFIYFASELGFLETPIIDELLRCDVGAAAKRFSTRQLVHVIVAMYRFDLTKHPLYSKLILRLGLRCKTTRRALDAGRDGEVEAEKGSADGNEENIIKSETSSRTADAVEVVIPKKSVAHPDQCIEIPIIVELVNCLALSPERPATIFDAISSMLVSRQQELVDFHRALRYAKRKNRTDATLAQLCKSFEKHVGLQGEWAPTAHQLNYVLSVFLQVGMAEHGCRELQNALITQAALEKGGVILDSGGDSTGEEGTAVGYYTADFVKLEAMKRSE